MAGWGQRRENWLENSRPVSLEPGSNERKLASTGRKVITESRKSPSDFSMRTVEHMRMPGKLPSLLSVFSEPNCSTRKKWPPCLDVLQAWNHLSFHVPLKDLNNARSSSRTWGSNLYTSSIFSTQIHRVTCSKCWNFLRTNRMVRVENSTHDVMGSQSAVQVR